MFKIYFFCLFLFSFANYNRCYFHSFGNSGGRQQFPNRQKNTHNQAVTTRILTSAARTPQISVWESSASCTLLTSTVWSAFWAGQDEPVSGFGK